MLTPRLNMITVTILMIGFSISSEIIALNGFKAITASEILSLDSSQQQGNGKENLEGYQWHELIYHCLEYEPIYINGDSTEFMPFPESLKQVVNG